MRPSETDRPIVPAMTIVSSTAIRSRVALSTGALAPVDSILAITRRLTLQGFTINKQMGHYKEFASKVGAWVASGELVFDETVVDGIDNTVDAFLDLMKGANTGKMVVRI